MADLDRIITIAENAGALATRHFGNIDRLVKRGEEAVTEADRAVQRQIAAALLSAFPDDGLIGEENDDGSAITNRPPTAGERVWVVDPIDGTNNFIAGYRACAVCIGLLDHGLPILGVVHDFTTGATYAAATGTGAWRTFRGHRQALKICSDPVTPASVLMLTANILLDGAPAPWALKWLTEPPWKVRMVGSSAIETCQVAEGSALAAVTLNGKLWDVAAPAAIVLEAGGQVVNLVGQPLFPIQHRGYTGGKTPFIAGSPIAIDHLLADIRRKK